MVCKGLLLKKSGKNLCLLALILLLAVSCDKSYDLNDLSKEIHLFDNGLTAPVGKTGKFYLTDFITETDLLVVRDGQYVIQYEGNSSSNFSIPKLMLDPIKPSFASSQIDFLASIEDYPEIKSILDAVGYTGGAFPYIDGLDIQNAYSLIADKTEYFSFEINDIAPEVVNIQSFTPAEGSIINLILHAEGLPQSINYVTFNFRLKTPSQLIITPIPNDILGDNDGYWLINRRISCSNGAFSEVVPFLLQKVEFNPAAEKQPDNTASVETELFYGGTISIQEEFNLGGWTPQMELSIGFESPSTIDAIEATARIETDIDPIDYVQELGDLPDMFNNPNTRLDLQSVMIDMNIANGCPGSLETNVQLQSSFNDGSVSSWVETTQPIMVNANAEQNIVVTNDKQYAGTAGYIDNLNELMFKVPREIRALASPRVPATDVTVRMGTAYNIDINYDIVIPITFGDEVDLYYEDSFNDLGNSLQDITDWTTHLILKGRAVSTIPLDLNMRLTPVDDTGKVINGLAIEDVVLKGDATTDFSIEIKQTATDALRQLDGLKYVVSATSANGGDLRPDEYLQFTNLAICIPGGIDVKLQDE